MRNDDIVVVKRMRVDKETEKAALVNTARGANIHAEWVPYSLVTFHEIANEPNLFDLEMPRWLAEKKDFNYEE